MSTRCTEWSSDGQSSWQCRQDATGDDGLCGRHRAGKRRKEANRKRWDEEMSHEAQCRRIVAARERYINQWRAEHPLSSWLDPWLCPLCGVAIQVGAQETPYLENDIDQHKRRHGADWRMLESIGPAAPRPAAGSGRDGT